MIDYIKAEILNTNIENFINNPLLDFSFRVNNKTGAVDKSELSATYNGLSFVIRHNRRLFISGSLPKYYFGNNYSNLTINDFRDVLKKLESDFNISSNCVLLQNVEFGVCVNTKDLDPTEFISNEIIDYKYTPKETRVYGGKGYSVVFRLNNYVVKLYDKGKKHNLSWNALRFEIRVKKMVHLKGINVSYLNDLKDINKWIDLQEMILKTFQNILICRNKGLKMNDINDRLLFRSGTNQQYWITFKPKPQNYKNGMYDEEYIAFKKQYFDRRNHFIELISKYNLDSNKNFIRQLINSEIKRLIN